MEAYLLLEDGTLFKGLSFGADGETIGEVVFNTSLTGYQEILTDPSYNKQIVTMTYPLIGNYGINDEDIESRKIFASGLIVKEYCKIHSNWRSTMSLGDYLKKNNKIGIEAIDTRKLTRIIRTKGAMQGIISTIDKDKISLLAKLKSTPGIVGRDIVKEVTGEPKITWDNTTPFKYNVVAFDYGIKYNILRRLNHYGCKVTVVKADTSYQDVLSLNPDGIFLSNGPGDPEAVTYSIENVKNLIGKKPIFGICLGHQILALALGGKTYKLKFGHRGGNHPVKNLLTQKVEITSQNHGFTVDINSLNKDDIEVTHINLNDNTLEGIRHKKLKAFSVQYHPEASPGPHDSDYLFDEFIKMMGQNRT